VAFNARESELKGEMMRSVLTLILLLITVPGAAEPIGEPADTNKVLSPYFFIDGGNPGVESFPLKSTRVIANISGVIADVAVTQVYENKGERPIHAKYVFPGSTRAAVHGMRIRVGNKAVVAKIQERQKAAQEFEEAKAAGKSASLLEQQRPNVFTMAVANIMPGDQVEVELQYSELLVPEQGIYEFVYPTVVGPRYSNKPESLATAADQFVKSAFLHEGQDSPATFSIRVNVSTGVPLGDLRSPSHQTKIEHETPSVAHVSLDGDKGNKDFILDYKLSGKEIQSGLIVFEGVRENFFLLTVQPPERVTASDIPPREYVFVLDVSGSMHGFPLDTAKQVLKSLIGRLKPTETFNVVLFSGGSRVLAPQSLAANSQNVTRAVSLIDGLDAGGGTELEAALRKVIRLPRSGFESRSVVVVTDGFIAEEKGVFDLIHENLNTTNFFAFGIGSSVNRYLIEGIAKAGMGEPFVVIGREQADAAAERFRSYIESPVLTNIDVRYRGFDAFDVEPQTQPDLFAERPVVLFGKFNGARTGQIEVRGRTAQGVFSRVFNMQDSVTRPEHAALPQLWARTRIARLSDFSFGREDAETIQEVTNLGLTYNLLTPHTSFIAVLEEIRNPGGTGSDVDQPLPLPEGVSDLAVGYGSGAEPGFWVLMFGAALLAVIIVRRKAVSC
jgi:Ca-activated chloride channel family protein